MSGYRDTTEVKTADWASFYRAAQDSLIKEHTGIFSLAHGCVQKAVRSLYKYLKYFGYFHESSVDMAYSSSFGSCRYSYRQPINNYLINCR